MSRFLKLSTQMINLSHIKRIENFNKKIVIQLQEHSYEGFLIMGSGHFKTDKYRITICAEKDKVDYDIIQKWIAEN